MGFSFSPSAQNQSSHKLADWFLTAKPIAQPKLRLFCFPFAGGSPQAYFNWHQFLPASVEVSAICLPGRAQRMAEQPLNSIEQMVQGLVPALAPALVPVSKGKTQTPYVFFGHSMGATLAYETMLELKRQGLPLPAHLIVSGRRAPSEHGQARNLSSLPKAQFIEALKNLEGTPKELLEHQELMELLEPILRADFAAIENWRPKQHLPFNLPITAMGGTEDHRVSLSQLAAWQEINQQKISLKTYSGGHFFIQSQQDAVLKDLTHILEQIPQNTVSGDCSQSNFDNTSFSSAAGM
ncbi:thioesterase II family protein [Pelagibaculum spongiae]|uniref:Putative thioesterase n=1 Tax=Pelagibaculum spongiae TaxID=2080658 RepID=A0A2V1GTA6_9GAMM|nr:thioesterase domain-containing protein [Pelagibaculum spongiae]PVZ68905.1 putative thioesterase [Pelagibaculum spongiae]